MRTIATGLSLVCLAGNFVPALLYLAGRMDLATMKTATLVATVAWFVVASFWIYGTKPPALAPAAEIDEPVVP
jgi:hypothetical protein